MIDPSRARRPRVANPGLAARTDFANAAELAAASLVLHRPTLLARSLKTIESLLGALAAARAGPRDAAPTSPANTLGQSRGWVSRGPAQDHQPSERLLGVTSAPSIAALVGPVLQPWSLQSEDGSGVPHADVDLPVAELAELLIAGNPQAACDLLSHLHRTAASMAALCGNVVEPAARRLGDLWLSDDCSELEVTVGLCRMQTELRRLAAEALHTTSRTAGTGSDCAAGPCEPPAVLVAPLPGEMHILGATLDAELLWQAGCDMQCEFPADDAALQGLVANSWFDALDLSLSAAFRREHWLPRMASSISKARAASRNPNLVIVVGGRIFSEREDACGAVGADASHGTAPQTMPSILLARDRCTASPVQIH